MAGRPASKLAAAVERPASRYAGDAPTQGRPATVVLIDNYEGFVETVGDEEGRQEKPPLATPPDLSHNTQLGGHCRPYRPGLTVIRATSE
jgi:hypothetical protein